MRPLIAVDWGTSSLRAARLDEHGCVLEERSFARGILTVPRGGFADVFDLACGDWMDASRALALIGGMAGSRQGWLEAPYCACPTGFEDIAAQLAWLEPGRVAIVPGLCCGMQGVPDGAQGVPDVMRGEETQVFGAMALLGIDTGLFVLPGTHSKWVRVVAGRIESFSTFMTGEFYALLRQHSILARTLPEADGDLDEAAFVRGLEHALQSGNLLHAAFSARTLSLFERLPAAAAPSYLSGLVIGEELRSQDLRGASQPVTIVASQALAQRYELALRALGAPTVQVGSGATWRGLWAIAQSLERVA